MFVVPELVDVKLWLSGHLTNLICDELFLFFMELPLFGALPVKWLLPHSAIDLLKGMINLLFLLSDLSQLGSLLNPRHVSAARVKLSVVVNL